MLTLNRSWGPLGVLKCSPSHVSIMAKKKLSRIPECGGNPVRRSVVGTLGVLVKLSPVGLCKNMPDMTFDPDPRPPYPCTGAVLVNPEKPPATPGAMTWPP